MNAAGMFQGSPATEAPETPVNCGAGLGSEPELELIDPPLMDPRGLS